MKNIWNKFVFNNRPLKHCGTTCKRKSDDFKFDSHSRAWVDSTRRTESLITTFPTLRCYMRKTRWSLKKIKTRFVFVFQGFSPIVMKTLVDSSDGGARAQLSLALSKMVERQDCTHQYANNRAKEMVQELAKDESILSSELRYLQPLVYNF